MNERNNIELISNYENGKLSELELIEFNQRLHSDEEFKNLYQDYLNSIELLKLKELCEVHQELEKYDYNDGNFFTKNRTSIISTIVGTLLAVSLSYLYLSNSKYDQKTIGYSYSPKKKNEVSNSTEKASDTKETKKNLRITYKRSQTESSVNKSILLDKDSVPMAEDKSVIINDQEHISVPKNEPIISPLKSDCNSDKLKVDYDTDPACLGKSTGSIRIKKVQGTATAYSISLEGKGSFKNNGSFTKLPSGNYTMIISDNNNCVIKYPIQLPSIACSDLLIDQNIEKSNDFVLYIAGETWKIPMESESQMVEIRSQQGELVFQKTILSNESEEWNGQHINGQALPSGIYFYSIKSLSNSEVKTGTISIINY